MAGSFVNFAQAPGATSPRTCNKPTGTTSGDVMVAFHSCDFGTLAAMTGPAGWTLLDSFDTGSNNVHYKLWTKTAGGSEAATYDFAQGSGADGVVIIITLRGVDEAGAVLGTTTSAAQSGTTFTAPSVTGTWPTDSVLLSFCMNEPNNVASTYTAPSGMTESGDGQSTTWNCASAAYLLNPTDPTGTKTFTTSQSSWAAANALRQSVVFKATAAAASDDLRLPIQTIRVP